MIRPTLHNVPRPPFDSFPSNNIYFKLRVLAGTIGRLQASKGHQQWLANSRALVNPKVQHKHAVTSLQLHVKSFYQAHVRHLDCLAVSPLSNSSFPAICALNEQKPADLSDTGEAPRPSGQPNQPAASGSRDAEQACGVRWLDREVRAGNVAREQLEGREDQPPPLRTDVILRSYSMVQPNQRCAPCPTRFMIDYMTVIECQNCDLSE